MVPKGAYVGFCVAQGAAAHISGLSEGVNVRRPGRAGRLDCGFAF